MVREIDPVVLQDLIHALQPAINLINIVPDEWRPMLKTNAVLYIYMLTKE